MTTLLGLELFGFRFPSFGILGVAIAFMVVFFLMSRNGGLETPHEPGAGGREGHGRMYQCTRCGRNFQPEQIEYTANGGKRVHYDDRCPNCGWDLDWGNADKKPGGASGGW